MLLLLGESLAYKCIDAAYKTLPDIEKLVPGYITIGFVDQYINNRCIFEYGRFTDENIKSWLVQPPGRTFSSHVWLTLPSLEIIDFTLLSTLAVIKKAPDKLGEMILAHPVDLIHGLAYHPMIVSEDFCFHIGAMGSFGPLGYPQ